MTNKFEGGIFVYLNITKKEKIVIKACTQEFKLSILDRFRTRKSHFLVNFITFLPIKIRPDPKVEFVFAFSTNIGYFLNKHRQT